MSVWKAASSTCLFSDAYCRFENVHQVHQPVILWSADSLLKAQRGTELRILLTRQRTVEAPHAACSSAQLATYLTLYLPVLQ